MVAGLWDGGERVAWEMGVWAAIVCGVSWRFTPITSGGSLAWARERQVKETQFADGWSMATRRIGRLLEAVRLLALPMAAALNVLGCAAAMFAVMLASATDTDLTFVWEIASRALPLVILPVVQLLLVLAYIARFVPRYCVIVSGVLANCVGAAVCFTLYSAANSPDAAELRPLILASLAMNTVAFCLCPERPEVA
ncbi:MAG: hypothetical protein CMJ48_02965 [Planctomycetaceae bacterium]|nr:hypothetical protein [Planctomycetaceae bacterium]